MDNNNVTVAVRALTHKEVDYMCEMCNATDDCLGNDRWFTFDYVFDQNTKQRHIDICVKKLIEKCAKNYSAIAFACGQTGCGGKTYKIGTGIDVVVSTNKETNVIRRAIEQLFNGIDAMQTCARDNSEQIPKFKVSLQFIDSSTKLIKAFLEEIETLKTELEQYKPEKKRLIDEKVSENDRWTKRIDTQKKQIKSLDNHAYDRWKSNNAKLLADLDECFAWIGSNDAIIDEYLMHREEEFQTKLKDKSCSRPQKRDNATETHWLCTYYSNIANHKSVADVRSKRNISVDNQDFGGVVMISPQQQRVTSDDHCCGEHEQQLQIDNNRVLDDENISLDNLSVDLNNDTTNVNVQHSTHNLLTNDSIAYNIENNDENVNTVNSDSERNENSLLHSNESSNCNEVDNEERVNKAVSFLSGLVSGERGDNENGLSHSKKRNKSLFESDNRGKSIFCCFFFCGESDGEINPYRETDSFINNS